MRNEGEQTQDKLNQGGQTVRNKDTHTHTEREREREREKEGAAEIEVDLKYAGRVANLCGVRKQCVTLVVLHFVRRPIVQL